MLKSRAKGSTVQVDFVCGEVEFIVQAGIKIIRHVHVLWFPFYNMIF